MRIIHNIISLHLSISLTISLYVIDSGYLLCRSVHHIDERKELVHSRYMKHKWFVLIAQNLGLNETALVVPFNCRATYGLPSILTIKNKYHWPVTVPARWRSLRRGPWRESAPPLASGPVAASKVPVLSQPALPRPPRRSPQCFSASTY